jgi:hypothetical protein
MLYNASKRARNATSTTNRNQGGGNKKAGLPYQIGRESYTSVLFGSSNPVNKHCFSMANYSCKRIPSATSISRPIGSSVNQARGYYSMF